MSKIRYKLPEATFSYDSEDKIDDELKCAICFGPFDDPVYHSPCGNTFCRSCIAKVDTGRCPHCRKTLQDKLLVSPRALRNMVNKLNVKCDACCKVVRRENFDIHANKTCKINCPLSCGKKMTRAKVDDHMKYCPQAETPCIAESIGCTHVGKRKDLQDHETNCPLAPVAIIVEAQRKQIATMENYCANLEVKHSAALRLAEAAVPSLCNNWPNMKIEYRIEVVSDIELCDLDVAMLPRMKREVEKERERRRNEEIQLLKEEGRWFAKSRSKTVKIKLKEHPSSKREMVHLKEEKLHVFDRNVTFEEVPTEQLV